jgi:hypothetical protein
MQLKGSAWLKIAPDDPQVMEWFLEQASKLEKLLSFLSGEVFVSDSIQSQIDQSNRVSTLFAGNEIQSPRRIWPKDFFLSRPSISAPFSAYCTKWFEVFTRIVAPATLAMSVMASEHLWIHIRFLSLFHVLEGFHRALYSGKYMEADAYNSVWKDIEGAIPGSVSGSHRSALVSRIKYGNEYSLRKRLGELEQSLTDEIRLHLLGPTKSIPVTWVNTRNYYTHWDDELKEKILDDQEMYYANVRIAHFLNTLFAILVGVPASDIESAFHGTSNAAQELIEINIIDRRAADPTFIPHAIMTISSGDNAGVGPAPFSNEEGST